MADIMTLIGGCDGPSVYETTVKECLENRILILNDEINDDIIEAYIIQIFKWNMEDKGLPTDMRKPIRILINSPGGDAVVGMGLVDAITQSKTKVIGIGVALVASAAFHIYISCHERYSFANTIFLMHDGEIAIQNSSSKARDTMEFFERMEKQTKDHVVAHTKIDGEYYDKVWDSELYMYPEKAKELGVLDKIVGVDCDIDELFD